MVTGGGETLSDVSSVSLEGHAEDILQKLKKIVLRFHKITKSRRDQQGTVCDAAFNGTFTQLSLNCAY
jgi:hypothetical protein